VGPEDSAAGEMERRAVRELIERLERDAERIAGRFRLAYRSIEAERANVKSRYGVCYDDGRIKIRLRHAVTGRPLKYSSLVNTLCHELAHLRHFNHGERFKAFYLQLLEYARREGIYRPGPEPRPAGVPAREATSRPGAGPVQLALF
jgi:predicted metal-dependent hydrolase